MESLSECGAAVGDIPLSSDWITPLLLRYEGPLLRYAQKLMNCPDKARDVVQETFLRLCREPTISRESHVAEWLFTVCRNYALDLKRKERRMNPAASAELGNTQSPALEPDRAAEHNETAARVLSLVKGLPDNQQAVLMLKFQASLSYREIAGVTGLSVSNVGYLIHQGLSTLRRHLKSEL
jgi:RNA polymerase sigma-70 factor (ECF subfamily)